MTKPTGPRRIWNVPCALMDAVLALSFDDGELENLLSSARVELPCRSSIRRLKLRDAVHQLCHSENTLSLRVEKTLHYRFAEQTRMRDELGCADYVNLWFFDENRPTEGFAGALWAIATADEPDMLCVGARVGRYVTMEAFDGFKRWVEERGRRAPASSGP